MLTKIGCPKPDDESLFAVIVVLRADIHNSPQDYCQINAVTVWIRGITRYRPCCRYTSSEHIIRPHCIHAVHGCCLLLQMYTVSQKRPPFYVLNNSVKN